MSYPTYQPPPYNSAQTAQPIIIPPDKHVIKSNPRWLWPIFSAGLFALGLGIGFAGGSTLGAPVTPKSCVEYSLAADNLIDLQSGIIISLAEGLSGVMNNDMVAVNKAAGELEKANPKIESYKNEYDKTKQDCLSNR